MSLTPSLPAHAPVLIVGAGPTGLTLAIELARRNMDCLLIDRNTEPLPFDRATVIHSRSLECFDSMGVIDDFLERGHLMRGLNLFAFGEKIAAVNFDCLECRHPYDLNLSENITEEILAQRFESLGGQVFRGWSLDRWEQIDSKVTAFLRSANGVEQTVSANWLVGTDGIHSRVREAMGVEVTGHRYAARWGVVDGHLSHWQHEPDRAAIQLEAPALNPVPLPEGRWRIYFREQEDSDATKLLDRINIGLDAISPGSSLQEPDTPMLYHTFRQLSAHYRAGRVLLAGDAAHACSPIEGHGMNTGIQDSFNLGWKLALVLSGKAGSDLLNSYEQERRPIAAAVGASGDVVEELRTIPDNRAAVARAKRAICAMLLTSRGQQQAAQAETELDFHYRDSPLVSGYHSKGAKAQQSWMGPLPGDCLPDSGPLIQPGSEKPLSLSQLLLTTGHLLLWMAADSDEMPDQKEIESLLQPDDAFYLISTNRNPHEETFPHRLFDIEESVHARLGVVDSNLFIIRPDGHIAVRSEPPELHQIAEYFERLRS